VVVLTILEEALADPPIAALPDVLIAPPVPPSAYVLTVILETLFSLMPKFEVADPALPGVACALAPPLPPCAVWLIVIAPVVIALSAPEIDSVPPFPPLIP
jgi:hypothetical protein